RGSVYSGVTEALYLLASRSPRPSPVQGEGVSTVGRLGRRTCRPHPHPCPLPTRPAVKGEAVSTVGHLIATSPLVGEGGGEGLAAKPPKAPCLVPPAYLPLPGKSI